MCQLGFFEQKPFMVNTNTKDRAFIAVRELIGVEKTERKNEGSGGVAMTLVTDKLNVFIDACRTFFEQFCQELLSLKTWMLDSVIGLPNSENAALLTLPKSEAVFAVFQTVSQKIWRTGFDWQNDAERA